MATKVKKLPTRSQVKTEDTWDLTSLFPDDDAWEAAYAKWEKRITGFAKFRGQLASSAKAWPMLEVSARLRSGR